MADDTTPYRPPLNSDIVYLVLQCLPVPDVAKPFLAFEDYHQIPIKDAGDLVSAARVNKVFSEQALSLLWRKLYDIKPLLRILPTFKLVLDITADGRPRYVFSGEISSRHWERMLWYAKKVKHLDCRRVGLDYKVLEELIHRTNGEPLFTSLDFFQIDQEPILHKELLLFISPNLQSIAIDYETLNQYPADPRPHDPEEEALVFQALCKLPRRLRTFRLFGCTIAPANLDIIFKLADLEELDLVRLNPHNNSPLNALPDFEDVPLFGFVDAFETTYILFPTHIIQSLPKFSKLRWLSLTVDRISDDMLTNSMRLHSLKVLRMYGSCSSKARFLSSISAPVLYAAIFLETSNTYNADPWTAFRECTEILGTKFRESMHRVSVVRVRRDPYGPNESLMYVLEPLLDIPGLLTLEFQSQDLFSLQDEDIRRMAISWPNLFALQISGFCGSYKPTLECIRSVVGHLPHLNQLALAVDCAAFPPEGLSSIPAAEHQLAMMTLSLSNVRRINLKVLATELIRIFPFFDPDVEWVNWYVWDPAWDDLLEEVRLVHKTGGGPRKFEPGMDNDSRLIRRHHLTWKYLDIV